jgi:hypothetical protein
MVRTAYKLRHTSNFIKLFTRQEDCAALQEDQQEAEGDGDRAGEDRDHAGRDGQQAHRLHRGSQQVIYGV